MFYRVKGVIKVALGRAWQKEQAR